MKEDDAKELEDSAMKHKEKIDTISKSLIPLKPGKDK